LYAYSGEQDRKEIMMDSFPNSGTTLEKLNACVDSPTGVHEPDFGTIVHVAHATVHQRWCILNVSCQHCGHKGAFRVDTTDIGWENVW